MSLSTCIVGLVAEGRINAGQAAEAERLYSVAYRALKDEMSWPAAASLASEKAIAALEAQAVRNRYLAGLRIKTLQQLDLELRGPDGAIEPRRAEALFVRREGIDSVHLDGRREAIKRRAYGEMAAVLQRFRTNVRGQIRNVAELPDVVREIFGEGTGNASARAMADAWLRAAEMLRLRFNAAGGDIGRLSDGRGYLPQSHDWQKVRAATFEEWRDTILPLLDRGRMVDEISGRPFGDEELNAILEGIYLNVRSDGWYKRAPGATGVGAVANRRADPRFLVFRDADSWMEYDNRFGSGNAFTAMLGHVEGMARDIAAMERFGPNPASTVAWLNDTIEKAGKEAKDRGEAGRAASKSLTRTAGYWAEYTGATQRPSIEWLANVGQFARSYETVVKMGSATASAVPGDFFMQLHRARFNDLPFMKIMAQQLRLLNPKNAEHRRLAAEMGLVFEGWTNSARSRMRVFGDEVAVGRMGRLAEGVLRSSGLGVWTDSGQAAFGMTVLRHMAALRDKGLDELDDGLRGMLQRHGIGEEGWNAIRGTEARHELGMDWLFPQDIADRDLGDRVMAMLANEKNISVQTADFETRATMNAQVAPKGTWGGELGRNMLLFKSFGIGMLMMHGRQMMAMKGWGSRLAYLGRLQLVMTMAGATTIWLTDIAKGRDPTAISPEFLVAAWQRGAGFGMVSDLLGLVADPRMDNWAEWFAGPLAGSLTNYSRVVSEAGKSGLHELGLIEGEGRPGAALTRLIQRETPGGNLWYARTAFNRWIVDQVQEEIDPDYARSRRRLERSVAKGGSPFFWAPGEMAPDRAPDFSNIEGNRP